MGVGVGVGVSGWGGGGVNSFYCYQILVLYVVVKAQKVFASHGKRIGLVIDIQVPVCLNKVFINSSMQHLQNIISFNFLY